MLDTAVTVKDLVNGTKYLAELLNAGQVDHTQPKLDTLPTFPSHFDGGIRTEFF